MQKNQEHRQILLYLNRNKGHQNVIENIVKKVNGVLVYCVEKRKMVGDISSKKRGVVLTKGWEAPFILTKQRFPLQQPTHLKFNHHRPGHFHYFLSYCPILRQFLLLFFSFLSIFDHFFNFVDF